MLKNNETLQKAVECACHRLADNTSRQRMLERLVEKVMEERPDLAQDCEALAEEAIKRLPDFIKHIEER